MKYLEKSQSERTKRLKELRKVHRLSNTDIATMMGRTLSTVESWFSKSEGSCYIGDHSLALLEYQLGER